MIKKIFILGPFLLLIFLNMAFGSSRFFGIDFNFFNRNPLPKYDRALMILRTNVEDSYMIRPLTSLYNSKPVINSVGDIAVKVMSLDQSENTLVWAKNFDEVDGRVISEIHNTIEDRNFKKYFDHPVMSLSHRSVVMGLFRSDRTMFQMNYQLDKNEGTKIFDNNIYEDDEYRFVNFVTQINEDVWGYRATKQKGNREIVIESKGKIRDIILSENDSDHMTSLFNGYLPGYIFSPSFNSKGNAVFKVRLKDEKSKIKNEALPESNPDVLMFYKDAELKMINYDNDFDAKSMYSDLSSHISINEKNQLAYIANLNIEGDHKAILFYNEGKTMVVASDSLDFSESNHVPYFKKINSKDLVLNDHGLILFEGISANENFNSLVLIDSKTKIFKKIISEDDEVETDQGLSHILRHPNFPGFVGGFDMNNKNEIVFVAELLCHTNSVKNCERGQGLYKISPE